MSQALKYIVIIAGLFLPLSLLSQRDVSEAIGTPYIGAHYIASWTGGDLAERYGFTNGIGIHAGYKTKSNWVYGIESNFFFGNKIRIEGLLQNLSDNNGLIINTSGAPAGLEINNRGFNVNVSFSKIIPVLNPNPNSGIMIQLSAGYFWHKLKIQATDDEVPQLEGDYKKGYDRLTIGANVSEFIGYNFMANRGIVNFYVGAFFLHGFTKNQRDVFWDHPEELVSKKLRIEHLIGLKAGWLIPVYKRQTKEFYFN